MNSIYFVINASTMEHPDQGTVPKLRLCECFHDYPSFFNVHVWCKASKSINLLTRFFTKAIDLVIKNFKSLSIVIPRNTSFIFVSMEEPSVTSVDGSLQLSRRWLLSLFAFIKLFLNYLKSFCDDFFNALITDSLFSFTVYRAVSFA